MFETGRHHADYLHCLSVKLNRASDYAWIASETTRPKTIGQDNHVVRARLELFRFKDTAVRRRHSKHGKEIGGACQAEQTFRRLSLSGHITARKVVGGHLLEDRILVVMVEEICRRKRPVLRVWGRAPYSHQLFGLRIRQRAK
jgi:hypothetical protein